MTDAARIATLKAELRDDTAFVATPTPRLSWTVETADAGWLQSATELTDGTQTVVVEEADSALVAWPFEPLTPGDSREVRVRVTASSGAQTDWSSPLTVSAGFLADGEWIA
ncbi:MAG TPA: alpha-L-rhamnosidase, partial [Microbacterium sp.]|nr:alpha-L-rhamnosidase [Microbacterium sp.]